MLGTNGQELRKYQSNKISKTISKQISKTISKFACLVQFHLIILIFQIYQAKDSSSSAKLERK